MYFFYFLRFCWLDQAIWWLKESFRVDLALHLHLHSVWQAEKSSILPISRIAADAAFKEGVRELKILAGKSLEHKPTGFLKAWLPGAGEPHSEPPRGNVPAVNSAGMEHANKWKWAEIEFSEWTAPYAFSDTQIREVVFGSLKKKKKLMI